MEEKVLKVEELDFLRVSMLYKDLEKRINVHKDKITDSIKRKAEIYKKKLKGIELAITKQYYSFAFVFDFIEGYNKTNHVVVMTYDTELSNLVYYGCDCDGFRKNKICSHIYGVYLWLEEKYNKEKREIEAKIKESLNKKYFNQF